jgi:limonene-1,2-epoxide hydrolase
VEGEEKAAVANVRAFERLHEALQGQDLDTVVALLDPEIEVIGMKGTFRGPEEVRRWATKSTGGSLYSLVEVDEVRAVGADHVAIQARRLWHWRENDELADAAGFGGLFRFRDGRVWRWRQDYASIVEAIEAVPLRG